MKEYINSVMETMKWEILTLTGPACDSEMERAIEERVDRTTTDLLLHVKLMELGK